MGDTRSPRISHLSWGRMEVDGYAERFRDVKAYPGGARAWDWRETGTRHVPGIQPADVRELLDRGATTVVLSRGIQEQLRIAPATRELLDEAGATTYVRQTEEAVELYNRLAEEVPVGGLFHSTC